MSVIPKELRRDRAQGIIAGVLAGLSAYLDIDRTVLRFAYGLLSLLTALLPGIVAYALMWALIPAKGNAAPAAPASP